MSLSSGLDFECVCLVLCCCQFLLSLFNSILICCFYVFELLLVLSWLAVVGVICLVWALMGGCLLAVGWGLLTYWRFAFGYAFLLSFSFVVLFVLCWCFMICLFCLGFAVCFIVLLLFVGLNALFAFAVCVCFGLIVWLV